MRAADHIVDIGPGAGVHGGELVAQGTVEDICKRAQHHGPVSLRKKQIEVPEKAPQGQRPLHRDTGRHTNNLKNINVKIPLGVMTCVTGISGSGKSSLINEILAKRLAGDLNGARIKSGAQRICWGLNM